MGLDSDYLQITTSSFSNIPWERNPRASRGIASGFSTGRRAWERLFLGGIEISEKECEILADIAEALHRVVNQALTFPSPLEL